MSQTALVRRNETKVCTICHAEKLTADFYKKRDQADSICKTCKREKRRIAYKFKPSKNDYAKLKCIADVMFDFYTNQYRNLNLEIAKMISDVEAKRGAKVS